jgi:hypothetical protein
MFKGILKKEYPLQESMSIKLVAQSPFLRRGCASILNQWTFALASETAALMF